VSPGKVSPHHQQGSKKPWAAPPAPLARADPPEYGDPPGRSVGWMAPSPMSFGASTPSLTKTTSPQCTLSSLSPSHPSLNRGGANLAEHRAATVLQCWKRRLWLRRWFDQQATLKQKRLRLQALCHGASAYASLVWGNRRPPPTPTDKPSDPKVSNHPFRKHGQPLPPRKRGRRHKRPHRRPGRRHRPRAPNSGGRPSCMPLVFWATQTMAASSLLGGGEPKLTSYISPTSAASNIQQAYRLYLIRRTGRILPHLSGAYKSRPDSTVATEEWATKLNASYRSTLASIYQRWAHLPFTALVSYLSELQSLHVTKWPPLSSDYDTLWRECNVRTVLLSR
jgi:hypothetical protein